jgi:hypothetical protein
MDGFSYAGNDPINYIDPIGHAIIEQRPLETPVGEIDFGKERDNKHNVELRHENIRFEDGKSPSNIGAYPDGIRSDDPKNMKKYNRNDGIYYDDKIMREAVKEVTKNFGDWKPLSNNCQHFADQVRETYNELNKKKK